MQHRPALKAGKGVALLLRSLAVDMRPTKIFSLAIGCTTLAFGAVAANANDHDGTGGSGIEANAPSEASFDLIESAQERPRQGPSHGGPPPGVASGDSVIDDTWITLGVGAGLVPSYSGSDDYVLFPLPLIVGRVGGVGISPNGPGLNLDVLSQPPGQGVRGTSVSFGPSFRFRNDRDNRIRDDVVAAAGRLDTALEVGVNGGVSFPAMLNRFDRLTISTSARWDVLGAHDGMLVEPSVSYFTPMGRGSALQLAASAQFVDDDFAEYYYSVSPAQSTASGLPRFDADGGINSVGLTAIATFDLGGDLLDGGFNVYAIGGYSRLVGDAADTPYTSVRGSADQFIGGIGIGYTF